MEQPKQDAKVAEAPKVVEQEQVKALVDLRDSYLALVVSPGFEAVHVHLRHQRSIAEFMAGFMDEFATLNLDFAKKMEALAEGTNARFERSFVQKAWLGIKSIGQSSETLSEIGTTNTAWQSVREGVQNFGIRHAHLSAAVKDGPAASLMAYLKESEVLANDIFSLRFFFFFFKKKNKEQASKIESWGLRLTEGLFVCFVLFCFVLFCLCLFCFVLFCLFVCFIGLKLSLFTTAMANYVRKAEESKSAYYSKARGARMASKILEEAEKQSQIGGITRNIILTSSRMDKMKEAAEKSREEELESAKEYRAALELVAKKRNELYSIRMPRVMTELQLLVEQRTDRIKVELKRFAEAVAGLVPRLLDSVAAMEAAISGISPVIDTRVFVAQAMSDNSIPDVLEFVPFDAASAALIAGAEKAKAEESNALSALLRDSAKSTALAAQLAEKDAVAAAAVRFLIDVAAFQAAETFDSAIEIYHKFLSDESVELVPVKPEVKRAVFERVDSDNYSDRSLFDEACKVKKTERRVHVFTKFVLVLF
jgi:hypothetical protein